MKACKLCASCLFSRPKSWNVHSHRFVETGCVSFSSDEKILPGFPPVLINQRPFIPFYVLFPVTLPLICDSCKNTSRLIHRNEKKIKCANYQIAKLTDSLFFVFLYESKPHTPSPTRKVLCAGTRFIDFVNLKNTPNQIWDISKRVPYMVSTVFQN